MIMLPHSNAGGTVTGYFRIVGTGAQAPEPIEKVASTAVRAEAERSTLQRLCGRHGTVEVSGKNGRLIGPKKLRRLAQDEAASGCDANENPKAQG